MSTQVQFRRGTTAQTASFTGVTAEITVDTTKNTVVVHDGSTAGGFALAKESASNTAGSYANSAYSTANSAQSYANAAFASANTTASAGTYGNSAFGVANSAASYANSGFITANSAGVYANSAFAAANAATATDATQNTNITSAASYANSGFAVANSASSYANGAFIRANNSINANTGGTIGGDLSIIGNLTVTGLTTYTNTTTVLIADNIITVNAAINQAAQPAVNAGIEVDRGAQPNSSILWIETSGKWSANNGNGTIFIAADSAESYANAAFISANLINGVDLTQNTNITNAGTYANSGFAVANSASLYANSAFLKANTPDYVANSAASYANAAFTTANSAFAEADSTAAYANAAFAQANTDVTNVNITSGTYGNAAYYPVITVSSNGRINVVTTQVVTDPSAIAFAIALG